jgi:hypothetical protein
VSRGRSAGDLTHSVEPQTSLPSQRPARVGEAAACHSLRSPVNTPVPCRRCKFNVFAGIFTQSRSEVIGNFPAIGMPIDDDATDNTTISHPINTDAHADSTPPENRSVSDTGTKDAPANHATDDTTDADDPDTCKSPCWLENHQPDPFHETTSDAQYDVPRAAPGTYNPIKHWQIRVLCLEPGEKDDDILIRLEVAHLSASERCAILQSSGDEVPYHALSYSWGHRGVLTTIICNGQPCSVLASVKEALVALRHARTPVWLWIDAICINQHDLTEKANQISRMFTIFRRALSVKVYLGTREELGPSVIRWLLEPRTNHRNARKACRLCIMA